MKKGQILEGIVQQALFPNKGIVAVENIEQKVIVKNTIPGQKVRFSVNKLKNGKAEGRLLEILERSPQEKESVCPHFSVCGGCSYQTLPYKEQLKLKESQVKTLLDAVCEDYHFEGMKESPCQYAYRNKMEFSFGDEIKDGPLSLGMHKRGSFYDIVTVENCQIVDEDFRIILQTTLNYFSEKKTSFYHKMTHHGFLRHLLVRKGVHTEEILICLVTSSQGDLDADDFVQIFQPLALRGKIVGILHIINDSLADIVQSDETRLLAGRNYLFEQILDMRFKISPFSFFQTNSLGAEVLYQTARDLIGSTEDKIIFDLYSGTGTIAQILAPVAKKVIAVEIVVEAVEAAKENAKLNNINNCQFIAGDVLKIIDEIPDQPDIVVLDPPREGLHPKALVKIATNIAPERLLYISCKPTSLARDLAELQKYGYAVERSCCVDMFPGTGHVETCVLLGRK